MHCETNAFNNSSPDNQGRLLYYRIVLRRLQDGQAIKTEFYIPHPAHSWSGKSLKTGHIPERYMARLVKEIT